MAAATSNSPPPPVSPPPPKASIGDFGLDLTAGKPALKPGDDFVAYASGNWLEHFEIPPDRASFGVFNQLDELSKNRVKEIIEQAAASHPGPGTPAQKIGDYYAAFMDLDTIETQGLAPVQEDLKRISVPVLVMHGDDDQIVPYEDSAPLSAGLVQNGTLRTYEGFPHGMPTTQADTINADLLAFLRS